MVEPFRPVSDVVSAAMHAAAPAGIPPTWRPVQLAAELAGGLTPLDFLEPGAGAADNMAMMAGRPRKPLATILERGGEKLAKGAADVSFSPIKAGDKVSGGIVAGERVDNMGSIAASLDDYTIEPGIQKVPLKNFYGGERPTLSGSASDVKRTKALAEEIRNSGRMDPLIVVLDEEGTYVLEGGHRLDAAYLLGMDDIPALVVREGR